MPETSYKKFFDLDKIIADIKAYMPGFNEKLFLKAYHFAEKAHRGQMRKDGKTPYIVHPISTVQILAELHADQDVIIGAILHDVPEDTRHSIKEVGEIFDKKIAFLVGGITKLSKVQYKHNMPERQIRSLKKLFLHSAKDIRVILIKLADRLHNMRTLNFVDDKKRLRIAQETLEIYVPIANLLGMYRVKKELEDLCFKYIFPTEFTELTAKFDESDKRNQKNTNSLIRKLSKALVDSGIEAKVKPFKRGVFRAYKKIRAQGKTISDVKDRVAIRIVADDITACYQALGVLNSMFPPKPDRFKDYIAHPKLNGYRALHTVVFGLNGVTTEVQILSKEMEIENEFGISTEFFIKQKVKRKTSRTGDTRAAWVNKVLELGKTEKISESFLENLKLDILEDRIVAFTPKGDAIDLPRGASALDFAYSIHTDLGHHAHKAEVNGKKRPITTILKTRDVVHIIKNNTTHPRISWLSFVKTSTARNRIMSFLRKRNRSSKIMDGRRILQREFDIAKAGLVGDISIKRVRGYLMKNFRENINDRNDLFVAVAEGRVSPLNVIEAIGDFKKKPSFFGWLSRKINEHERGVEVTIKIKAMNRFGLLREISEIVYRNSLDIIRLKARSTFNHKYAKMYLRVLVSNVQDVSRIFKELEQNEDIVQVYRVSNRSVYWFYGVALFTAYIWTVHPILLQYFLQSGFIESYRNLSNVIIFSGLLMLGLLLLYLNFYVKRSFPLLRNTKFLWAISFVLITIAVIVIFSELQYFQVDLAWVLSALFAAVMYAYLALSYLDARKKT